MEVLLTIGNPLNGEAHFQPDVDCDGWYRYSGKKSNSILVANQEVIATINIGKVNHDILDTIRGLRQEAGQYGIAHDDLVMIFDPYGQRLVTYDAEEVCDTLERYKVEENHRIDIAIGTLRVFNDYYGHSGIVTLSCV